MPCAEMLMAADENNSEKKYIDIQYIKIYQIRAIKIMKS